MKNSLSFVERQISCDFTCHVLFLHVEILIQQVRKANHVCIHIIHVKISSSHVTYCLYISIEILHLLLKL